MKPGERESNAARDACGGAVSKPNHERAGASAATPFWLDS